MLKIKDGFSLKTKSGENVIVSSVHPLNNTIVLNETASFLWKTVSEKGCTKEELLNALLSKYDISTVLALNDIDIFVRTLKENGILENE